MITICTILRGDRRDTSNVALSKPDSIEAQANQKPQSVDVKRLLTGAIPYACILLAVAVVYRDLLMGRMLATNDVGGNDFLFLNYPLRTLYGEALRHGEFLLWTPYIQAGFPVFAEGEGGFLYPPTIILSMLFKPLAAINAFLVFHAVIMGVGTLKFVARVTRNVWGAVPSGVAASICGSLVCGHTRHLSAFCVICLSPWLFCCAERFAEDRQMKTAFLAGSIVGLMALAGHPQYTAISWIVTSMYLLLRMLFDTQSASRIAELSKSLIRAVAYIAIATTAGIVIGWPQLQATAENAVLSSRQGPASASFAGEGSLPPDGILTLFAPYYAGDARTATYHGPQVYVFWEGFHYVGASVCFLAIVGVLFGWRQSPSVRALVVLCAVSYVLAVGEHSPAFAIVRHLPVLNGFRCPARWFLGAELGVISLAGYGLLAVLKRLPSRHGPLGTTSNDGSIGSRVQILTSVGVAVVVLVEVGLVAGPELVTVHPTAYLSAAQRASMAIESHSRLYTFGSNTAEEKAYVQGRGWPGDERLYSAVCAGLPPNLQASFHISAVRGYSTLALRSVAAVWGDTSQTGLFADCASLDAAGKIRVDERGIKLLRLWHVGTISSTWPMEPPFRESRQTPEGTYWYVLDGTFPRAWVVSNAVSVSPTTDVDVVKTLGGSGFDPHQVALVSGNAPKLPRGSMPGAVDIVRANDQSLELRASTPGLVVLSDTWYPRWRATVDGTPATVLRVNSSMRGVVSPHRGAIIRFWYDNHHLFASVIVSFLSLITLAFLGLRPGRTLDKNLTANHSA